MFGWRGFWLLFWSTLAVTACPPASASPSDCAMVRDHDLRNLCYALAYKSKTYCEFIKDHDLRLMCRVRVTK